jgi:hypothetical protein
VQFPEALALMYTASNFTVSGTPSFTIEFFAMSYLQLRDSSISETEDEKEDAYRSTSQNESRLFSYRNLFGATLISWLATAISLIWIILRRSETVQSHAATPLPFTKGTTRYSRSNAILTDTSVPSRVLTFNPDARFHYTAADTGNAAWSNLMPSTSSARPLQGPILIQSHR